MSRKRNDAGKFTQHGEQPLTHVMRVTTEEKELIEEQRSKGEDTQLGRDKNEHL
ncbi:MAG: hypothetical protein ACXACI_01560 [Candidatus Hodarchaeales archaeon]|jgi:hypothetical protein